MIQLNTLFTDNMTLQCEKPVKIWGEAKEAEQITVSLNGKVLLEKWVEKGEFSLLIPAQEAMENATLCIGNVTLRNVDFGEVWIAGGQSNMEFELYKEAHFEEVMEWKEDEHIRFYNVGRYAFYGEKEEFQDNYPFWDRWMGFLKGDRKEFSAVGLYFAYQLRKILKKPVAIVGCNWGGTTASTWVPEEMLTGNLNIFFKDRDQNFQGKLLDRGTYRFYNFPELKEDAEWYRSCYKSYPGRLFGTMVKRITGYTAKGILWYQGESDAPRADYYEELFRCVIKSWREAWKEELPFLFAQLPPFDYWMNSSGMNFPIIREAQRRVEKETPNCHMISLSDAGEATDIHPREKRVVGDRMAQTVLKFWYGKDLFCEYPMAYSAQIGEGQVRISFQNGEGLYVIPGQKLHAMELWIDGNRSCVDSFRVENTSLILYHTSIHETSSVWIRFAETPYYQVNLYNKAGIPAIPFTLQAEKETQR